MSRSRAVASWPRTQRMVPISFNIDLNLLPVAMTDAARLIGESDRLGTPEAGKLADVVAYHGHPMSIPVSEFPSLRPEFTMVGGRIIGRMIATEAWVLVLSNNESWSPR